MIGFCPRDSGPMVLHFKCPGYYCIAWSHLCNQIWDCPLGNDELQCHNRTSCKGQLKCYNSFICVHAVGVCDTEADCPHGDDEYFCVPSLPLCPSTCSCLLFTISCQAKSNNSNLFKIKGEIHVAIFISNHSTNDLKSFIMGFPRGMMFSLKHNEIHHVCKAVPKSKKSNSAHMLDVSYNVISKLQAHCFSNFNFSFFLNISHNLIEKLRSHTFENLGKLKNLDLSFNSIRILEAKAFQGLFNLRKLTLLGNSLLSINILSFHESSIANVITETSKLCCLILEHCTSISLHKKTCRFRLLNDNAMVVMMVIGIGGTILASITIVINVLNVGSQVGANYRNTVHMITVSDCLISICLIVLGSAHVHIAYGSSYFEHEYYWRKNALCFICATLFLCHSFMSFFVINIMALTRLQVTRYPLHSKFLENINPTFGRNLLTAVSGLSVILSISIIITQWTLTYQLPSGLCVLLRNYSAMTHLQFSITVITLILTTISIFSVPVMYIILYRTLERNKLETSNQQHKTFPSRVKQYVLTFINHPGWISGIIILWVTMLSNDYPHTLLTWFTTVVMPLPSVMNPFVFTLGNLVAKCTVQFTNRCYARYNQEVANKKMVNDLIISSGPLFLAVCNINISRMYREKNI